MTTTTTAQVGHASKKPTVVEIDGFRGRLISADHADYDSARAVWNGAIDRHPRLIARCTAPPTRSRPCVLPATTIWRSPYGAEATTWRAPPFVRWNRHRPLGHAGRASRSRRPQSLGMLAVPPGSLLYRVGASPSGGRCAIRSTARHARPHEAGRASSARHAVARDGAPAPPRKAGSGVDARAPRRRRRDVALDAPRSLRPLHRPAADGGACRWPRSSSATRRRSSSRSRRELGHERGRVLPRVQARGGRGPGRVTHRTAARRGRAGARAVTGRRSADRGEPALHRIRRIDETRRRGMAGRDQAVRQLLVLRRPLVVERARSSSSTARRCAGRR